MPSRITTVTSNTRTIDFIQSDLDYQIRTDQSVNPKPSELIAPYSDGTTRSPLVFTNYIKQDMAGGLASKSYPLPVTTDGTPMYFGMDWQLIFRKDMWPKIPRLELDDKVMLADATKTWSDVAPINHPQEQMNESHQWNATTGEWQYDPDGQGWQGIGFKPQTPMLLSDAGQVQINEIRFRWWWNGKHGADGLWSSLAMMQNAEVYQLPAKFQNLPLIAAKWGGPIRHPQIQTEGALPSGAASDWHAFTIVRGRLVDSTQPIDINRPWDPYTA